jgi:hypothetical protein
MTDIADDVLMWTDGGVQSEFEFELFRAETAGAKGMVFVDELYGDDGTRFVFWNRFANAGW